MSSDADWLFESVQQFLASPSWALPVMSFIDENCIVFDSDDENKFAYMEIYQAFKDMVESLLEFHLSEMGVTMEAFYAALASNPHAHLVKTLLEQLLVIDDFLSFKKMMVKRNAELEAEALGMIARYQERAALGDEADDAAVGGEDGENYELQLERAMKLSMEEAREFKVESSDLDALRRQQEQAELEMVLAMSMQLEAARAANPTVDVDAQLERALAASRAEAEAAQRAARLEADAQMQAAAAASAAEQAAAAAAARAEQAAAAKKASDEAAAVFGAKFGSEQALAQEQHARELKAADPPADASATAETDKNTLATSVKGARQAQADAAALDSRIEPGTVRPAQSAATRAVASLAASAHSHQSMFVADPKKASDAQRAQLKRAEEAAQRAAEVRKRDQQHKLSQAAGRPPAAGVALSATTPTNGQIDTEIEVQKRAEHMRRQRELLLLQKRNQALASVSATQSAGYSSGTRPGGSAAAGGPSSVAQGLGSDEQTHAYLANQRKELEGRLNKDEAAKQAEVERIQKQKASLNAMLLKPLM